MKTIKLITEYSYLKGYDEDGKLCCHLPLNNSPILKGVDLLPPLENDKEVWEKGLENEINKLPYTKHLDDGQYNDGQLAGFELGAIWGYNKAKEKYKYTEEDIYKAYLAGMKFVGEDKGSYKEFIQSLQQSKIPVAFECEMVDFEVDMGLNEECIEYSQYPKTTINSEDNTQWIGEYIYD